jgi:hypothetical protein
MHLQIMSATRPKLALNYAGAKAGNIHSQRRSPTLSAQELRRIVAERIG